MPLSQDVSARIVFLTVFTASSMGKCCTAQPPLCSRLPREHNKNPIGSRGSPLNSVVIWCKGECVGTRTQQEMLRSLPWADASRINLLSVWNNPFHRDTKLEYNERTSKSVLLACVTLPYAGWPFPGRGYNTARAQRLRVRKVTAHACQGEPESMASSRRCSSRQEGWNARGLVVCGFDRL